MKAAHKTSTEEKKDAHIPERTKAICSPHALTLALFLYGLPSPGQSDAPSSPTAQPSPTPTPALIPSLTPSLSTPTSPAPPTQDLILRELTQLRAELHKLRSSVAALEKKAPEDISRSRKFWEWIGDTSNLAGTIGATLGALGTGIGVASLIKRRRETQERHQPDQIRFDTIVLQGEDRFPRSIRICTLPTKEVLVDNASLLQMFARRVSHCSEKLPAFCFGKHEMLIWKLIIDRYKASTEERVHTAVLKGRADTIVDQRRYLVGGYGNQGSRWISTFTALSAQTIYEILADPVASFVAKNPRGGMATNSYRSYWLPYVDLVERLVIATTMDSATQKLPETPTNCFLYQGAKEHLAARSNRGVRSSAGHATMRARMAYEQALRLLPMIECDYIESHKLFSELAQQRAEQNKLIERLQLLSQRIVQAQERCVAAPELASTRAPLKDFTAIQHRLSHLRTSIDSLCALIPGCDQSLAPLPAPRLIEYASLTNEVSRLIGKGLKIARAIMTLPSESPSLSIPQIMQWSAHLKELVSTAYDLLTVEYGPPFTDSDGTPQYLVGRPLTPEKLAHYRDQLRSRENEVSPIDKLIGLTRSKKQNTEDERTYNPWIATLLLTDIN